MTTDIDETMIAGSDDEFDDIEDVYLEDVGEDEDDNNSAAPPLLPPSNTPSSRSDSPPPLLVLYSHTCYHPSF